MQNSAHCPPNANQPTIHVTEHFGGYDQNYIGHNFFLLHISAASIAKYPKLTKMYYNPPRRNSPNIELLYIVSV